MLLHVVFSSVLMITPFEIIISTLTCLVGLVLYAYYEELGCDPLRSDEIDDPNKARTFLFNLMSIPGDSCAVKCPT